MSPAAPITTSEAPPASRTIIKGLSLTELQAWCVATGEPGYRGDQLFDWLYGQGVSDPQQMDNLPLSLRQRLTEQCRLQTAAIDTITASPDDNTRKYLLRLTDDSLVETVSMLQGDRHTVCLSSQIGCNVGCTFCATATMGLQRNLIAGELLDQFLLVQEERGVKVTNVVFMGMGEPFLNYKQVLASADLMHHERGPGLGARRITISTAGVVPKIRCFTAEARPYRLAVSLNASDDETRNGLVPLNRKWPLAELLTAAREYGRTTGGTITFEYVLLAGINDSPRDARRLLKLLHGCRAKLNVIPYNEIGGSYHRPDEATIEKFAAELRRGSYPVMVRWSNGVDIAAGCGQLVTASS